MNQRIVTLHNAAGHALYCMLHMPDAQRFPKPAMAVLLLSPGVKMRVAPHRLYRKLAATFLERGMAVLRVDFHGLGDSEGELPETQLDQLYRQVQLGRHKGDVTAAVDWVERELGIRRVVVGGLCGGALTGLIAAEADRRVAGLYTIGIPVSLDGTGQHSSATMTRGQLESLRKRYVAKLLDPQSWVRLLSFKSDLRLIWRSLTHSIAARRRQAAERKAEGLVPAPATAPAANLNPLFPRAFFSLLRAQTPILLLFSGADRLKWEFDEKFAEPWAKGLAPYAHLMRLDMVEKANHVLSDPAWVTDACRLTASWLDERFGMLSEPGK